MRCSGVLSFFSELIFRRRSHLNARSAAAAEAALHPLQFSSAFSLSFLPVCNSSDECRLCVCVCVCYSVTEGVALCCSHFAAAVLESVGGFTIFTICTLLLFLLCSAAFSCGGIFSCAASECFYSCGVIERIGSPLFQR